MAQPQPGKRSAEPSPRPMEPSPRRVSAANAVLFFLYSPLPSPSPPPTLPAALSSRLSFIAIPVSFRHSVESPYGRHTQEFRGPRQIRRTSRRPGRPAASCWPPRGAPAACSCCTAAAAWRCRVGGHTSGEIRWVATPAHHLGLRFACACVHFRFDSELHQSEELAHQSKPGTLDGGDSIRSSFDPRRERGDTDRDRAGDRDRDRDRHRRQHDERESEREDLPGSPSGVRSPGARAAAEAPAAVGGGGPAVHGRDGRPGCRAGVAPPSPLPRITCCALFWLARCCCPQPSPPAVPSSTPFHPALELSCF